MNAPPLSFEQTFGGALRGYDAGRLVEAEAGCRAALAIRPNDPDALHLLGVIAYRAGQLVPADELIGRAVAGRPGEASYRVTHAAVLLALGRVAEAVEACRVAVASEPGLPEAQFNLGNALHRAGDLPGAASAHHRATTLRPHYPVAMDALGVVLQGLNRPVDAVLAHKRALAMQPSAAEIHYNLGNAHRLAKQPVAAMLAFRQAVRLRPDHAAALNNLAGMLRELNRPGEAVAVQRQLLATDPGNAKVWSNMGNALEDLGERAEAMAAHDRAAAVAPADPLVRWNRAVVLLRRGRFAEGWREYEARWGCDGFPSPKRAASVPQWGGEPLGGRRIVVHDEQGFGDTIQFARYVPLVAAAGGRVTFEVAAELVRLMRETPGAERVIARGEPWPAVDLHVPLLSLPHLLGTTLATVPAEPSRVGFDAAAAERWRQRLPAGVRVGLVWAGRGTHLNDHNRSVPPHLFAPLMRVPGLVAVGLQKGGPPAPAGVVDVAGELDDFADTAAVVSALDHVVAVDTAVAHLAATLGRPTHLIVPFNADYRWLLDRADSPWYRTLRVYRQPKPGGWAEPIGRVVAAIGGA